MLLTVDLHIHSHFSRATSKQMNCEDLYYWGKIKGINIIGTGDFTHPSYFQELRDKLEPAEPGLFKLKDEFAKPLDEKLPKTVKDNLLRFVLSVEISNIYSKNQKVRKLHNLVIFNSFADVSEFNTKLSRIGNLKADGRPILGMDSYNLLKLALEVSDQALFIPAHIWTPWFSMFGSKSGFDSIEEAFGDLASEIKAIETGLSSDPYMNWRIKELQDVTILSNSDAHSPMKLGREATLIKTDLSYDSIINAIKTNNKSLIGTIEFFPEEGKYHYDGHRVCNIVFTPLESKKHNNICPVCKRPLVLGVEHRVEELANFPEEYRFKSDKTVEYIIPLAELVAEIKGVKSTSSRSVMDLYMKLINSLGDEFSLLRNVAIKDIAEQGFPEISHSIELVRKGEVNIEPGYDGVYGKISVYSKSKQTEFSGQASLL